MQERRSASGRSQGRLVRVEKPPGDQDVPNEERRAEQHGAHRRPESSKQKLGDAARTPPDAKSLPQLILVRSQVGPAVSAVSLDDRRGGDQAGLDRRTNPLPTLRIREPGRV